MTSEKTCIEKEYESIERWTAIKLPNRFKIFGWILAVGCFVTLLWFLKVDGISYMVIYSLKTFGVLGLAMIVLAKEKVEDEMVDALRGKAMLFAFVCSILFMIITPYITALISFFVSDNAENIAIELSHFNMLSCVMLMYILGLEVMKRLYKC